MTAKKPPDELQSAGRPLIGAEPMRKVLVTLDEATIEKAKKLGKGNLSAGIRTAFFKAIRKS